MLGLHIHQRTRGQSLQTLLGLGLRLAAVRERLIDLTNTSSSVPSTRVTAVGAMPEDVGASTTAWLGAGTGPATSSGMTGGFASALSATTFVGRGCEDGDQEDDGRDTLSAEALAHCPEARPEVAEDAARLDGATLVGMTMDFGVGAA